MGLDERSVMFFGESVVGSHAKAGKEFDGHKEVTVRDEDFERGTIKFIHRDGYGFITRTSGAPDVYFHVARLSPDLVNQLEEGTEVLVAVGESKRGPAALMVKLA
jgi:cold shock CspA family protein